MSEPFARKPLPRAESPDPVASDSPDEPVTRKTGAVEKKARRAAHRANPANLDTEERHLRDYIRILLRHRWVVLTTFLVVVLSVSVYTFAATPIYEASVQLLIEKESANVVGFKEAIEQNQVEEDYYQTQYRILQSRALARRTIEALALWNHPQFNRSAAESSIAQRTASAPSADESRVQSNTIDDFLSYLSVSPFRKSRLVEIRFASPDAALSATVANALARAYIDQNLQSKFLVSKEASDWLAARLAEQRQRVETSELAMQRYREQTDAVSLEDRQKIVVQKLADLNAAITGAKTERIQKQAAYDQIRQLQDDRAALDTFPAIVSNIFIQQQKGELAGLQRQQAQLSDKFGPNHPEMKRLGLAIQSAEAKIQGEIVKVVQAMGNDYEQSLAQERSLMSALDQQRQDALSLDRKGIEYGVLARDAASNRQIFEGLLQRTRETGISGELKMSNIRVVDPAETPRTPASPNVLINLLLALFGGATLAGGLGFFFEYIDNRIHDADEVKRFLSLPFLGVVPALVGKGAETPLLSNGVPPNFSESLRAIRTNLLFSSDRESGRSLMVTSTGPDEGKTVVATNLAIALAQAGRRVLLVDADMRKPRVHAIFDKPLEPGLSNVIVGNAKVREAVHPTTVRGLSVMPGGVQPSNPAELLGSEQFQAFMAAAPQQFDWVLLDTPPVTAATDSSVVAHMTEGVLFVVGADMTRPNAARWALEQLQHARANLVGAVLNRGDFTHNSYYGSY